MEHPKLSPLQPPNRWSPLLIFTLLIIAILSLAYNRFEDLKQSGKNEAQQNLAAIAELKGRQIESWMAERRMDALVFSKSAWFSKWLLAGAPENGRRSAILERLITIQETGRYSEIRLLDETAAVRLSTKKIPETVDASMQKLALEAMRTGTILHSDLRRFQKNGVTVINLDIVAPLILEDERGRHSAGAMVFCIDPYQFLYPLIQSWPTSSPSAETVLIRREQNDVLYLNELRHRKNTALNLRYSINKAHSIAATAMREDRQGIIEGTDYRDVPVLAMARKISGTPWYMVAKVDQEEIYAPIRKLVLVTTATGIIFVVFAGALAILWWRQQHAYYLARRSQDDLEYFARLEHFDYAARYTSDIILLLDSHDRIIEANERALEVYGYSREEMLQLTFKDLQAPESRGSSAIQWGTAERRENVLCENFHQRKDKSTFATEVNARVIKVDNQWFRQTIIRDITERKETEKQRRLTHNMMENIAEGILVTDAEKCIIWVNPAFTRISGFTPEDVIGKTPHILSSGHHAPEFYRAMWASIGQEGHWQGEMWDRKKNGELYQEWLSVTAIRDENGKISNYVGVFADITQQKEGEERMRFLATHDALTELPNRTLFMERLELSIAHAKRDATHVALLFIDLDLFKRINDTLGHPLGDKLLQEVAKRFQQCLREIDMVARLGGDEFTVILENLAEPEEAALVAQKFINALSKPFDIDGNELIITPSIGISIYPDDGEDVHTLVKNSDIAMYRAKSESRNTYRFFSRDMSAQSLEYLLLENSLRHALEREELLLFYQPQMDASTGRVIGMEALLRWRHPELGMVMPSQFIPMAEESGLILPIGEWILRTACSQGVAYQKAGLAPVRMAVNLSAKQFMESNLLETISTILRETGLDPGLLEVEITESSVMSNADDAIKILQALKDLGVHIAIDDFGTGYSSLSYLKRFPIDTIKIDRAFVADISHDSDNAAITKAVISLGQILDLNIITEGVETQEQLDFLVANGCHRIQGFFFATPMPADAMMAFLKEHAG